MIPSLVVSKPWVEMGPKSRLITIVETDCGTWPLLELAKIVGLPPNTIRSRLSRYHWSHPCIFSKEKICKGFDGGMAEYDDENPFRRDPETIKNGSKEIIRKSRVNTPEFRRMIDERDMEYRRQLFATIGR